MRFLSPYSYQGDLTAFNRMRREVFSVDCRAVTNSAPLFPSCKRVARDKVRGRIK